jgi:hypothetical protein
MITRIYKYELPNKEVAEVIVPVGAKFRHVGEQYDKLIIWFEVDPTETDGEVLMFNVYATGQNINWNMGIDRKFIGTVQKENGTVWHVYQYTGV